MNRDQRDGGQKEGWASLFFDLVQETLDILSVCLSPVLGAGVTFSCELLDFSVRN